MSLFSCLLMKRNFTTTSSILPHSSPIFSRLRQLLFVPPPASRDGTMRRYVLSSHLAVHADFPISYNKSGQPMASLLSKSTRRISVRGFLRIDHNRTPRPRSAISQALQLGHHGQWSATDGGLRLSRLEHKEPGKRDLLYRLVHSYDG